MSARISPRLVLGLFVLAAGLALTLDNFGYIDSFSLWRWWPVAIIAVGIAKALQSVGGSGRVAGLAIAGVGTLLLLDSLRVLRFDWWDLWPIALVLLGAGMVWSTLSRNKTRSDKPTNSNGWLRAVAVLGGTARGSNSNDFRGGETTAFLGSCEIDLRQASISGTEAVLDTLAMWGAIEVRVPEDWSVSLQGMPLLGSFEDKTRRPGTPNKQLTVKGLAVMGSVEITN